MKSRGAQFLVLRFLLLSIFIQPLRAEVREAGNPGNASAQRGKPYVLLISLDGFRHDYAERYGATNLLTLGRAGVRAESLVPVYPSSTFPTHYSMVTGVRPEMHGLVAMDFQEPRSGELFSYSDGKSHREGKWFGGTPLWVVAEKQGMRSAPLFWVGSEAEIQGIRPSYWVPYDAAIPHDERVQMVIRSFRLPEELRPHFLTLYFSDVDAAGHRFGPDAEETGQAVQRVDATLGVLLRALRELPFEVNVIVVSDHGMAATDGDAIELHLLADLSGVTAVGAGSLVMFYSKDPQRIEEVYGQLHGKDSRFEVYRRREIPAHLRFSNHERIGDLVVIPNGPYSLAAKPWLRLQQASKRPVPRGVHGYDPSSQRSMHGIFFAAGPNVAAGVKVAAVDSLDIHPLITTILGLKPPPQLDGSVERIRHLFRDR